MKEKENVGKTNRLAVGIVLFALLIGTVSIATAAETTKSAEPGKFEVVAGSDDKAYLVDTVTGAVWVLTYRTMATGREPIAIPYKFILRTPKNQGEFLTESIGAGSEVSLPPSGSR